MEYDNKEVTVIEKLGEGGQGAVYRAEYDGGEYALKWYAKPQSEKFYQNLKNNIKKGAPSDSFIWPLFITKRQNGSFGYLMNLIPSGFKNFSSYLLAREKFKSLRAITNAAINIARGFKVLHGGGFSYQDLNDGNFFIHPETGEVLIADNDNVAQYSEYFGVAGKRRYMAPEIVRGERVPSVHTDRYSLAAALFLALFNSHPLEGAALMVPCVTENLEKKFYGSEPVFIFDPADDSNRPVRGVHNNALKLWPAYPEFIRAAFIRSFTYGLQDEKKRLTDLEWEKLFLRLRDIIIECIFCGEQNFFTGEKITCGGCKREIDKPLTLLINKYEIILYPKNKIYATHLGEENDAALGETVRNKKNPALWGVRNDSDFTWNAGGHANVGAVAPGEVVPALRNVSINFKGTEGVIK